MKKLFILLFVAILFCSCGNRNLYGDYVVGNEIEQKVIKTFLKNYNKEHANMELDFEDYYIGGMMCIYRDNNPLITNLYYDPNSVLYTYADKSKPGYDLVYLINEEQCIFRTKYEIYIDIYYGRNYYIDNFCKQISL